MDLNEQTVFLMRHSLIDLRRWVMNLWKIMVFIGLGIFTVLASGQENDQHFNVYSFLNSPRVLGGIAKTIENELEDVSRVSNLSISHNKKMINFTITTTQGDVFDDFSCGLSSSVRHHKKRDELILNLVECGNSVAKFEKKISIPQEKLLEFYDNDVRTGLN